MLIDELRIYKDMRREAPFGDDVEVTIGIIRDAAQAGLLRRSDLFYIDEICRKAEKRAKRRKGEHTGKIWRKRLSVHSARKQLVFINLLPELEKENEKLTVIRPQIEPSATLSGKRKEWPERTRKEKKIYF